MPTERNDAVLDAAIAWHAKLQADPTDADWVVFTAWLEADERHRLAFDRVEDLEVALEELAESEKHVVVKLPVRSAQPKSHVGRLVAAGIGLLAASIILFWQLSGARHDSNPESFFAEVGHPTHVVLSDGTSVDLSGGSQISTHFDKAERRASLDRGEAIFHIGRDPARPFILTAADRAIRDIGTVFDVLRTSDRVTVTVVEGRVAVASLSPSSAGPQDGSVQLGAGDQMTYTEGLAGSNVRHVEPGDVMAWRDGYLTYQDAPLSQVVDDLNRHFAHKIVLKNAETGGRRFSGVLRIEDEDTTVKRLGEFLALAAERGSDGTIVLSARVNAH